MTPHRLPGQRATRLSLFVTTFLLPSVCLGLAAVSAQDAVRDSAEDRAARAEDQESERQPGQQQQRMHAAARRPHAAPGTGAENPIVQQHDHRHHHHGLLRADAEQAACNGDPKPKFGGT